MPVDQVLFLHSTIPEPIKAVCWCPRAYIDDKDGNPIDAAVCQVDSGGWYIVNDHQDTDCAFLPIGPFDDADDAVIHLRLIASHWEQE